MKKETKGWKVFDENLKCRNYQFEVGKTYKVEGVLEMCINGFHFHENSKDLFAYYSFDPKNRVCEVTCEEVITGDDKSVCRNITLIRELDWADVLRLVNVGSGNTGRRNTGNCNTGNCNTGNYNTGGYNTGGYNTGGYNTGNCNTGNCNTGNCNTGNYNTGGYNTGNWNKTDYCSGLFNTVEQKVPLFNGAAYVLMSEFRDTPNYNALYSALFRLTEWVDTKDMTDVEKSENPTYEATGGFLRKYTYGDACKEWWNQLSKENKELIIAIPGFDAKIFEEITGITVCSQKQV
jgi:hypothetical protein